MNMNIITNNHPRPLACLLDLPEKVRADFDYVAKDGDYTARFVQYKGVWYDVLDAQFVTREARHPMGWAMVVAETSPLASWHMIVSETYFSGVVFRWGAEDTAIVGRYFT
jgi:hypothetical protein